MKMTIQNFIEEVIRYNGSNEQTVVAVEELSELQKELCKYLRGQCDADHVKEEIADVQLMIWQLQKIFGMSDYELSVRVQTKVDRCVDRNVVQDCSSSSSTTPF